MKKIVLVLLLFACFKQQHIYAFGNNKAAPDSVYLFSFAPIKENGKNGLQFAWSIDKQRWNRIGHDFSFLKCDYGRWDTEKQMITPYLLQTKDGTWQCVWTLNDRESIFAQASSKDLITWTSQRYTLLNTGSSFLYPAVVYNPSANNYNICFSDAKNNAYNISTTDFKTYRKPAKTTVTFKNETAFVIELNGEKINGQIHKVEWGLVDKLIRHYQVKQYQRQQNSEMMADDATRFADLKPVDVNISVDAANSKPISNLLMGVFFEDLNYAADGGLYAELIQNRDFEYALSDREYRDTSWNRKHSWLLQGNGSFKIDSIKPIHPNNLHYAVLQSKAVGTKLINTGYDAIALKKDAAYNFSIFVRNAQSKENKIQVKLVSKTKGVLAESNIEILGNNWQNRSAVLHSKDDATDVQLELQPLSKAVLHIDMVSLFPQKTFRNRQNGLREDLAQAIADIHPKFVRFPGGCLAHGDGIGNIYKWKNTIGKLEERKPMRNLWGYHQTLGLGYFEYFRFCEDIHAEPVPVIAAGVPCQNSACGINGGGQQGGIPMDEMDEYVQDIIDLIEYANGDTTTAWGKKRAEAGHPAPFNLKYIGIGNEDLISDVFEERYTMIVKALQQKHPEVTVIGTVGPFFEGTDYEQGWAIADKLKIKMVDEHYYQTPGWFINNQNFYDKYDRSKSKVYLGEYASHVPGRHNNIETALSEALYLTAVERNGDVVSMASYAPLLARKNHTQWTPDMIYFDNATFVTTTDYEVQKMFGNNSGDRYLPLSIILNNNNDAVKKRIGVSVVKDSATNEIIIKLANLLPVPANTSIDLKDIMPANSNAQKIILTGKPADKDAKAVASNISINQNFVTELPAYSFTIIRYKTK